MAETQADSHARDTEGTEESRTLAADDEQVQREIDEIAKDPPDKLEDWPAGKAKYKTMGGGEDQSNEPYGEGETANLGPPDVQHHEDGSVTVGGEPVDNPEDYKGEPIPGGPTDPDAPPDPGVTRTPHDEDE